jgi:uncharacterized protein with HEPN domain
MSRDLSYLLDILLHAKDARDFTAGIDKDTFFSDHKTQAAVIRCLEVMGEAVKRLSVDVQNKYLDIPWSKLAKMRDVLIHAYDRVNLDIVWDTVHNDIPALILAIESIVPPEEKE